MKKILWLIPIGTLLMMQYLGHLLKMGGFGIVDFEFADATLGIQIMNAWKTHAYGDLTLLDIARSQTQLDFFFILCYVAVLMILSNWQMQSARGLVFNELLRLNLFLAVLAGLLDAIENTCLLHNFHHLNDPNAYWGSYWFALLKFVLLGWIILVWLSSWIKSLLQR